MSFLLQILAIGDTVLDLDVTHQSAIKLLQQLVGVVRLVVKRSQIEIPPPQNGVDEEAEQQQPEGVGEEKPAEKQQQTQQKFTTNDGQPKDEMVLQGDWTQVRK